MRIIRDLSALLDNYDRGEGLAPLAKVAKGQNDTYECGSSLFKLLSTLWIAVRSQLASSRRLACAFCLRFPR